MDSKQETYSTPRSASGFVLAVTLAMFTFWGGGLVLQLHSYVVDAPPRHAAAAAPVTGGCQAEAHDAGPCKPAVQP